MLGLNFNGFPLWHLKGVHRGGNSSLLLLTHDNFPLGTIHKIHLITPAEAKIICDKNGPVVQNFYVLKIYLNLFEISNRALKFENLFQI